MTEDGGRETEDGGRRSEDGGRMAEGSSGVISDASSKPHFWRGLIKWTVYGALGLVLLLGLLWAGLQTPWAKRQVALWVQKLTGETGDYQVKLEGLGGWLPFSITLKQASIAGPEGAWLELENFDFSLDAKALLTGTVHIKWLRMDQVTLSRLPPSDSSGTQPKASSKKDVLPSLPHIVVDDIHIGRIALGPDVAGRPMRFSLLCQVQTAQNLVQTHATLKDLASRDDAFELSAAYDLNRAHLKARVTYHEARNGLAAGLLKLKDLSGIGLNVHAEGPISHLKGSLKLTMGGYGNAALQYHLGMEEAISLAVKGELAAERNILPEQVSQLLSDQRVDLSLRLKLAAEKNLSLQELALKSGPLSVGVNGDVDLKKETMALKARIEGADLSPFLKGTGITLNGLKPVILQAKGPFRGPEVSVTTALANFSVGGARLRDMALDARALFEKNFAGLKSTSVSLSSQETKMVPLPRVSGPLKVAVRAQSVDFTSWRVNQLDMTMPGIKALIKNVVVDVDTLRFTGDLEMNADSLALLLPPNAPAMEGALSLNVHAVGQGPEAIKTQMKLRLFELAGMPPDLAGILGSEMAFQARAEMARQKVHLSEIHIKGERMALRSNGWFDLARQSFDVAYEMSLDRPLSIAGPSQNLPAGHVKSHGKASGKLDGFDADVYLTSEKLRFQDLDISDMKARLTAKDLPRKPKGALDLKGLAMARAFDVNCDFNWNGSRLLIQKAQVRLPGIDLSARANLVPASSDFSGKAKGKIASLAILKALAGIDAGGKGNFEVNVPARPSGGRKNITLNAQFDDLQYEGASISKLSVKGQADDLKALRGNLQVNARNIAAGTTEIETVDLNAAGDLKSARVRFKAHGKTKTAVEAPFSLKGGLSLAHEDLLRIRLDELKGHYEDTHIHLEHPANMAFGKEQISVDKLALITNKGKLQVAGAMRGDTVQGTARVSDLPLSLLEPFVGQDLTGNAAVDMDLKGPMNDPGVDVKVHIKEYQVMGRDLKKPILVNVKLHSRRKGDRILADLELAGIGKTPFTASAGIPAHLSLKPFAFEINRGGALSGTLRGKLNLRVLNALPAMADQHLKGVIDIDLGTEGSLEKWALNGGITLTGGRYENVGQGIFLDRIQARIDAKEQSLALSELSATDGNQGGISLTGKADITPPFPMAFSLEMNQAVLIRKETLSVTTGGNLAVKGDQKRLDLTGKIDLDRTEIRIPKQFPPSITVIPVEVVNDPADKTPKEPEPSGQPALIQLDLGVNIPERFFVRGRGLDAEFKGRLTVQGPAQTPVVRGSLDVVRGTFLFLSRTFKIVSGQIAFDGSAPPVPFLNINTEVNAGEITAKVDVSGPADDFKLKLSSQPALPQDEIMAQILFGQTVAKLNTFQALQMAYSLNELAGGYGPDLLGKTRGFLGLDRLSFSGGDSGGDSDGDSNNSATDDENGNGPSVTLGKYVSDRVYVGVEQDLTDAKQDVIVEIDMTPNLTVESKAGSKSGAGVGFNWNYDY